MNLFLKKTIFFLSLPLLAIIFLITALNFINYKKATSKYLDDSVTTVFCGDSHIEKAIDDTLLKNCVNLAQNSESFYFTYYKLKVLLKNNPSVRQVCLGLSYHSLSSYYDKFIDGEFSTAISSRYFCLLPIKQKTGLLFANRNNLFSYLKVIIREELLNVLSEKKSYEGGFTNSFSNTEANEGSIEKRVLFQYYNEGTLNDFSSKNIGYLNEIKDLCEKSKVNLVLINTPVHGLYKNKVPLKFKTAFTRIPQGLKIKVLDLSDILAGDRFFIPDGDHVSQKGATATSEYLANALIGLR